MYSWQSPRRLIGVLATVAMPALAATGGELEEIIVSASRIGAVDQQIAILDSRDIERASFHGADLLRMLPGLALSASGNRGALTQARARGAEANHLAVVIDGVRVNDPSSGSEFDFGILDLAGAQRIEFLPGPQSAIWGSDALSGVLYLDTTPRRDAQRLALGYGSQGTLDADAEIARVGGSGYAALSLGRVFSDGTNAALAGSETDGFANTTAHLRAGTDAGAWRISFSGRWTDAEVDFDPAPAPDYVPVDGDRVTATRASLARLRAAFTGFEGFAPWLAIATARTRNRHRADGAFTNSAVGRRDVLTLSGNFLFDTQRANLTAEIETVRFTQTGPVGPFGNPNQRQRATTRSIAGEYQAELGRLAISASARGDFNDQFENAVAYRLGATTRGRTRLFVNAGRGVKNPTFTERFGYTPDSFVGNRDLEPETSLGIEAGVAASWNRDWGETTLALVYFDAELRDEINGFSFDAERGAFTARNIHGKSRRRGVETTVEARLGAVRLHGAYSYVNSRGGGEREPRRPRHLASLSANGPITPWLTAGIAASHHGRFLDQDFSTFPARRVELDGYRLLSANIELAPAPGWKLRLLVENALDGDYAPLFGYRGPGRATMLKAVVDL